MIKIQVSKKVKKRGAIVVIIDEQNRTLLLKRHPQSSWAPKLWGYPGGKIEKGESYIETATRETKEETNFDVLNLQVLPVEDDSRVAAYYTRRYEGDLKLDWEHEAWAWVSRSDAEEYDLAPNVLEMYDWVLKNG